MEYLSRIDDESYTVNCDGSLSDVCGHNAFPNTFRGHVKHLEKTKTTTTKTKTNRMSLGSLTKKMGYLRARPPVKCICFRLKTQLVFYE